VSFVLEVCAFSRSSPPSPPSMPYLYLSPSVSSTQAAAEEHCRRFKKCHPTPQAPQSNTSHSTA
jgi:hypothetical protein